MRGQMTDNKWMMFGWMDGEWTEWVDVWMDEGRGMKVVWMCGWTYGQI